MRYNLVIILLEILYTASTYKNNIFVNLDAIHIDLLVIDSHCFSLSNVFIFWIDKLTDREHGLSDISLFWDNIFAEYITCLIEKNRDLPSVASMHFYHLMCWFLIENLIDRAWFVFISFLVLRKYNCYNCEMYV